ncbi:MULTISPECIES: RNA-binding S4 domain-containing protein [Rhodanobacter]|uniref:RNA-binding S4 domain-containing protein n=1 Tax=Rhodanobacter hydrolyticus TaxID=2250595 RepID=A0ABW8J4V8_9GAMM|nr:RNA-binding S4 domain-containing protein [Rhodanobacter sp. 7MK24]MBD8879588.1 RNA-binding S4 domain-containing protein [Rhodanobacter sp. 7MK24]
MSKPPLRFELDRDYVKLDNLLKLVGICDSGGAGKHLVASGAVTVDGAQELRKTCKIHAGQVVRVGNEEILVLADPRQPVTP